MNQLRVATKYRDTVEYFRVMAALIKAAERRETITYQEVAAIMGLPPTGNLMGKETGQILGEISEDEHLRGRPLLSAIAIGSSGKPGEGFAPFVASLGKISPGAPWLDFWHEECEKVYRTWAPKSVSPAAHQPSVQN